MFLFNMPLIYKIEVLEAGDVSLKQFKTRKFLGEKMGLLRWPTESCTRGIFAMYKEACESIGTLHHL